MTIIPNRNDFQVIIPCGLCLDTLSLSEFLLKWLIWIEYNIPNIFGIFQTQPTADEVASFHDV